MLKTILLGILRWFAGAIIKKYNPEVVGITGSIGKTSTKEAVAGVLASRFRVRANYKNYNNEIGLPLTIIGIEKSPGRSVIGWLVVIIKSFKLLFSKDLNYPEILVLEMGADKPGDIKYLVEIAPCRVGVLTYISHAHTEFFKTIKRIAQEKRIIISHLTADGTAVLNFDNALVMENAGVTKAEKITYGFKEGADLRATDVNILTLPGELLPKGLNFKVTLAGSTVPVFMPGFLSNAIIPAALAGLAVGTIYGINLVEGAEALKKILPLPGHMRPLLGIKKTLIIDDSYNSSPDAVKSALDVFADLTKNEKGRRYAVLGDMLELGTETASAHREIGFKVVEHGIDFLVTVGEASKQTAVAAREAGLSDDSIASFNNSVEAGKFIQEKINEGDQILIKGSQGSRMEKIVKEIMAEPLQAEKLLVRQDSFWLAK
ncbi:MAG: UDP-N-acetylmuramoyl-tripeptide--D-alanyl-D-alanine ligase [Patescibacteria group bacterium]|jgi:UDP-N-acetylmuramoyl-tripeptide--D-alanyl-D-alanine ligase